MTNRFSSALNSNLNLKFKKVDLFAELELELEKIRNYFDHKLELE